MSKVVGLAENRGGEAQASVWIARLDRRSLSAREWEEFRDWILSSDANRRSFLEAARMFGDLDALRVLEKLPPNSRPSAENLTSRRSYRRYRKVFAIASSVTVLIAGLVLSVGRQQITPDVIASYSSEIGEHREFTLPDNSIVELNSGSNIEVRFGKTHRQIRLLRGEALFDVKSDNERPFEVYASNGLVRAIGTMFTVRLHGPDVEVLVTEGKIELQALDSSAPGSGRSSDGRTLARVEAGQVAVFNERIHSVQPIDKLAIERRLAWRDGMLSFSDERLEDIVTEVSRHTSVKIVIVDESIGDRRFGGYFPVGQHDIFLDRLGSDPQISVERIDRELVYISQPTD